MYVCMIIEIPVLRIFADKQYEIPENGNTNHDVCTYHQHILHIMVIPGVKSLLIHILSFLCSKSIHSYMRTISSWLKYVTKYFLHHEDWKSSFISLNMKKKFLIIWLAKISFFYNNHTPWMSWLKNCEENASLKCLEWNMDLREQ